MAQQSCTNNVTLLSQPYRSISRLFQEFCRLNSSHFCSLRQDGDQEGGSALKQAALERTVWGWDRECGSGHGWDRGTDGHGWDQGMSGIGAWMGSGHGSGHGWDRGTAGSGLAALLAAGPTEGHPCPAALPGPLPAPCRAMAPGEALTHSPCAHNILRAFGGTQISLLVPSEA